MAKKLFIGIKRLWYDDPATAAPTQSDLSGLLASTKTGAFAGATEILNVHQGTWGYSQDDPSVTEYINELNGKPYYRDKETDGAKTIAFTIGEYDYEDKVALQGGELVKVGSSGSETVVGWKSSGALENINKTIIGLTKTGKFIVFTNAAIIGKVDTQEKNLGLGITAIATESETTGVAAEYWFDPAN